MKSRAADNRLCMRGISASHCTQTANLKLMQYFVTAAIPDDHFLHLIAHPRELQPIAEAIAAADYGINFCFGGGVRELKLQAHRCAHRDGTRNIRADAAVTKTIGAPERGAILSVIQE